MMTVAADGWTAVRLATFRRDLGCVATQWRIFGKDIAPDLCKDAFGNPISWDQYPLLEFDHVSRDRVRYDDEGHGVMVCPWHHRLSQRWRSDSKTHRSALRAWLAKHYPEVWDAAA